MYHNDIGTRITNGANIGATWAEEGERGGCGLNPEFWHAFTFEEARPDGVTDAQKLLAWTFLQEFWNSFRTDSHLFVHLSENWIPFFLQFNFPVIGILLPGKIEKVKLTEKTEKMFSPA